MWDAFIRDLFSDTYTLRIQYEYTKPQCVGVAKVVTNKRVSHFTSINQFMGLNEDNPWHLLIEIFEKIMNFIFDNWINNKIISLISGIK